MKSNLDNWIVGLLYAVIFFVPWQTRLIWHDATLNGFTWEYGRMSLYGSQLLLWLLLSIYGVRLWQQRRTVRSTFNFQRLCQPPGLAYGLAVVVLLISGLTTLWAFDHGIALYRWMVVTQAGALMAVVVTASFQYRRLASVWVASASLQAGIAVIEFFNQAVPGGKWLGLAEHLPTVTGSIILQTTSERWLRAYGSLPHPNIVAGFLVLALLWLAYIVTTETKSNRIKLWLGLTSLIALAVFVSFSRSAWIALGVGLIWWWLWARGQAHDVRQRLGQYMCAIVVVAALFTALFSQPLFSRLAAQQELEANSLYMRLTFVEQAGQVIQQRWLSGVGIGNDTLAVYRLIDDTFPGYSYQPVHNLYLLALVELGVVGAAAVYALLGLALFVGIRTIATPEQLVAKSLLVAILIISFFDHYFWSLEFGVLIFWLVIGLNIRLLPKQWRNRP